MAYVITLSVSQNIFDSDYFNLWPIISPTLEVFVVPNILPFTESKNIQYFRRYSTFCAKLFILAKREYK